jgi:hypothetical protein
MVARVLHALTINCWCVDSRVFTTGGVWDGRPCTPMPPLCSYTSSETNEHPRKEICLIEGSIFLSLFLH